MIVNAIMDVLFALFEALFSGLESLVPPVPDWFAEGYTAMSTVMGYAYAMDHWLPVQLALTIAGALAVALIAAIAIQTTRTVLSYFTFGGGAS